MNRDMFIKTFDKDDDYYSGYFSNKKLTDIDDDYIASIITVKDLRKVSTQMKVSMGSFMDMVKYFGVIMFILLMYLLSKQIIEKNSNSIALTKILGYSDMEIGGLYIITTFVVVVISLLLAIPIVNILLHEMFTSYLYTQMTGYVPYIISNSCYVKMFIMGVLSYLVVCVIQMAKIRKIPKSDALKNVE
jgi:putative ABC transport system permease protein